MHRLRFVLVGLVLLGCSGGEGSTPPGGNSGGSTSTGGSGGIGGGTGGSQSDGGPDASSGGTSGTAGSPTGGSGGTSGTGGSGGTTSVCTPGEKKCLGSTAQHCNSKGTWDDQLCSTACIGGDCTACVPGSSDCQGTVPRSCNATGNWVAGASCSGQTPVCLSGSCVSCSPSSTQCSGTTAQTCNSTGFWQTTQTCPYVCSGGTCIGSCVPTAKKCSGLNVETCDSTGTWQFTQTCPTACNSGSCGSCVNGSTQCNGLDAQSCNASGQWVTTATCPYVCSSGSCTGSCLPGSNQCSGTTVQTCNSSGQWANGVTCPYVCASGACTGSCVPSSKKCVGNVPQTCDSTGTWQSGATCPYVCSGGSCTGVCVPGSTQCLGNSTQTCDATGQWSPPTVCPGAPNAQGVCIGNGTCSFTCNTNHADCDGQTSNGCEANLQTDTANCGVCGKGCCGSCSAANCVAGSTGISIPWAYFDVNDTTIFWTDGTSIWSRPVYGGSSTVVASGYVNVSWVASTSTSVLWTTKGVYNNTTGNWDGGAVFEQKLGSPPPPTPYGYYGGSFMWVATDKNSNVLWVDISSNLFATASTQSSKLVSASGFVPWMGYGPASDGTYAYFIDPGDLKTIYKVALTGTTPRVAFLANIGSNFGDNHHGVATDGVNVYYGVTNTLNGHQGLWKRSISTLVDTQLVSSSAWAGWPNTDGTSLYYFAGSTAPLQFAKVSVSGGAAAMLGAIGSPDQYPRLNSTCVYGYDKTSGTIIGAKK